MHGEESERGLGVCIDRTRECERVGRAGITVAAVFYL